MIRKRLPLISCYGVLVALGIILVAATAQIVVPVYYGQDGLAVDRTKPSATELAELATDITQYLVTLATGVLALVGLLLTDQFLEFRRLLTPTWRHVMAIGTVSCVLSLLSGFLALQTILHASADAVVRSSLEGLLWLHFLQFLNLGSGVAMIGTAVLWNGILHLSRS